MRTRALAVTLTLSTAIIAGGCWSRGKNTSQSLTADRFKAETPETAPLDVAHFTGTTPPTTPQSSPLLPAATSRQMGQDLDRVTVIVGPPPAATPQGTATTVGADVLADAMVGQINGRPVFANEILGSMDTELGEQAKKIKPRTDYTGWQGDQEIRTWLEHASTLILGKVRERVRDELQIAEARAHLPPELREQGLLPLLNSINTYLLSQSEGSQEKARENIAKGTQGRTLEEQLAFERDSYLIQQLQKDMVEPKVRVPWRKIERFYKDNPQAFSGRAVIWILMLSADKPEAVAKAETAAAAGCEAFKPLVNDDAFNLWGKGEYKDGEDVSKNKRAMVVTLDKPFEEHEFFSIPAWNEAARKLHPGEVTGPIKKDSLLVWIGREKEDPYQALTLEEAQLLIFEYLTKQKRGEELDEFFKQLRGKSSFTSIERMRLEILVIASERHLPSPLASLIRQEANLKPLEPTMQRSPTPDTPANTPSPLAPAPELTNPRNK